MRPAPGARRVPRRLLWAPGQARLGEGLSPPWHVSPSRSPSPRSRLPGRCR